MLLGSPNRIDVFKSKSESEFDRWFGFQDLIRVDDRDFNLLINLCRLFNQKSLNLIEIGRIWSKIVVFDQIQQIFYQIEPFWYIWIRIEIVATIDRTGKFGSKKSIKSQFEYNLDRISGRSRSNHISLINGDLNLRAFEIWTSSVFRHFLQTIWFWSYPKKTFSNFFNLSNNSYTENKRILE